MSSVSSSMCDCIFHDRYYSDALESYCDVYYRNTDKCTSITHSCVCDVAKSTTKTMQLCRADTHSCICTADMYIGTKCLASSHNCTCEQEYFSRKKKTFTSEKICSALRHECTCKYTFRCDVNDFACRTDIHKCTCEYSEMCNASKYSHQCICTTNTSYKCIAHLHICSCYWYLTGNHNIENLVIASKGNPCLANGSSNHKSLHKITSLYSTEIDKSEGVEELNLKCLCSECLHD